MSFEYVNRKGHSYYLHRGVTKSGTPRYYFSKKSEGDLIDAIPGGYEVYEHPNGQVYLRKVQPKIITDEEIAVVEAGVGRLSRLTNYQVDVKGGAIRVFTPRQDMDELSVVLEFVSRGDRGDVQKVLGQIATYSPELQFVLIDEDERVFAAERFCYLGSVDDWIEIGEPGSLQSLVEEYVRHLGKESFFDLY